MTTHPTRGTAAQAGPAADADLLTARTALPYLAARGLLDASTGVVAALGGGISNVVLAAGDGRNTLVLKQSLPRLRVADDWPAPQDRVLTEADALRLAGGLAPGSAPGVLDVDPARHVVVLERAPRTWTDWKSLLLEGAADPRVGARLGALLARWHTATLGGALLGPRFTDPEPFELLRVDPYYRTVARRAPDVAPAVLSHVEQMAQRRTCLVHGDLSPKNVLVGPVGAGGEEPGVWVLDWEVAHLGDPAFDLAFLLTHLTLKALHRPADASGYDACAEAFAAAYAGGVSAALAPQWPYVLGHVGCLLLARVVGKSPAEYLTGPQRDLAAALGRRLLAAAGEGAADDGAAGRSAGGGGAASLVRARREVEGR